MNRNMGKFAVAAVILVGIFVGFQIFEGTGSVSWAEVRQRVAAVSAVVYEATVDGTDNGQAFQLQIEAIQSDDYGTRMDVYMGSQMINRSFTLADENSHITLYPSQKKYMEVVLTEQIRLSNGDPKAMVEAFLQGNYKELGSREINGVTVAGIESSNVSPTAGFPGGEGIMATVEGQFQGNVTAALWVDTATGWPVEVTLDITDENGNEEVTIVVSDFQWEAIVDPEIFASVIPEGYSLMYTVNVGNMEEGQQIVNGLAHFAELSKGKYPVEFTIGGILGEIGNLFKTHSGDSSFQIDDGKVVNLKYGAQYFGRLKSDGKEPAYYGATVTAADTGKVLLRWKLDNGQYRVIFGDLRIEDVSPTKLAELEAK